MSEVPKGERTRSRILAAATRLFSAESFNSVSLRAVAREAGVDPSLIHHYFDSKEGLVAEVLEQGIQAPRTADQIVSHDPQEWGRELVLAAERLWTSPARLPLFASFRAGIGGNANALRAIIERVILTQFVNRLEGPLAERRKRATLVGSQMVGLMVARHMVQVEPLASLPIEEVAAAVGPNLTRYLLDPLD